MKLGQQAAIKLEEMRRDPALLEAFFIEMRERPTTEQLHATKVIAGSYLAEANQLARKCDEYAQALVKQKLQNNKLRRIIDMLIKED